MPDSTPNATVLVIDDDARILELVRASLAQGYDVVCCDSAQAAYHYLALGNVPDAIICAIMMPEVTGFEMHERIRHMPRLLHVPFIYLSALDAREYFRKGMDLGADDYITKPFQALELRKAVSTRLARAAWLQEQGLETLEHHPILRIQSLGGFRVTYGTTQLSWSIKKAAVAFLYLLHHQETIPLDRLKKELWWDNVADNTLYVLGLRLRKVVGSFSKVNIHQGSVTLDISCRYLWDVEHFENAAQQALAERSEQPIERLIQSYHGEFLPGFDMPWAERYRHHIDDLYLQLLEASVELAPNNMQLRYAQERLRKYFD